MEEDEATPGAAQGPSPFAAGPLPRTLFFRETGVTPWRARGKRVVVTSPPPRPPNRGGGRFQDEVVEEVDSDEEQGLLVCRLAQSPSGPFSEIKRKVIVPSISAEPKKCVVSFSTRGTSGEVAEEHLIARTKCVRGEGPGFRVTPCRLRLPESGEGGGGNGNPGGPADPQGLGVVPGFHNGFGGMAGANGTRTT